MTLLNILARPVRIKASSQIAQISLSHVRKLAFLFNNIQQRVNIHFPSWSKQLSYNVPSTPASIQIHTLHLIIILISPLSLLIQNSTPAFLKIIFHDTETLEEFKLVVLQNIPHSDSILPRFFKNPSSFLIDSNLSDSSWNHLSYSSVLFISGKLKELG